MPLIANGDRANVGDFSWHALLIIKYRSNKPEDAPTFCSGAILNEKWLLTPAKCLRNAKTIRVDVGSVNINQPWRTVYPDSYTIHSQYDNTNNLIKYNLALLRLAEKDKFNFGDANARGRYAKIELPTKRQVNETFIKHRSYFSGFGYTSKCMYLI